MTTTKKPATSRTKKTADVFSALSDFQNEVPAIYKGEQGYGYKYADLRTIIQKIQPILYKHNLMYYQPIDETGIHTILRHKPSGTSIESFFSFLDGVQLKGMNQFQVMGSQITYLRRYSLSSLLGLITDADTDAQGEQIKTSKSGGSTAKKTISHDGFIKLLTNYGMVHDGERINYDWITTRYQLTPDQDKTLMDQIKQAQDERNN